MRVAHFQRQVLKHWWFLALCVILAGLVAAINLVVAPTTYSVRTRLVLDLPSSSLVASQQYILTQINLATSSTILAKAAATLPGVSQATLTKEVSAEAVSGTDMFDVVVLDTNPTRGAQIANAVAQAIVVDGYTNTSRMNVAAQAMMQTYVDAAQQDLNTANANLQSLRAQGASAQAIQAAAATVNEMQTRYINVVQQMAALQVRQALSLYGLRIESVATPALAKPQPSRTLVIGLALALGFLAGVVGLLAGDIFDERFRAIKDPASVVPWELLGQVGVRSVVAQPPALPDDREGFETTLRSVRFLDLAAPTRHIAIVGVGRGGGAGEVAAGLALAAAAAAQRTVLIDAAFPRGSQAQRFGVNPQPGLTEALLDARSHGEAAQPANYLQSATTVNLPDLRLLTIGAAPAVSGRVAGAAALREQLYGLAQRLGANLVFVDATTPGRAREMAQLAAGADAVLVVVDLRTTRRADLIQMEQALSDAQAKVVGCVVARGAGAQPVAALPTAGSQRNVAHAAS